MWPKTPESSKNFHTFPKIMLFKNVQDLTEKGSKSSLYLHTYGFAIKKEQAFALWLSEQSL
jgi:hypothetical protein